METDAWFTNHADDLPTGAQENRKFIEDITGRLPLLLRPLLDMKVREEAFDISTFLGSTQMELVVEDITHFFKSALYRYGHDRWIISRYAHTLFTFVTESYRL